MDGTPTALFLSVKVAVLVGGVMWVLAIYAIAATVLWLVARRYARYSRVLCAVACMLPLDFLVGYVTERFLGGANWCGLLISFGLDVGIVALIVGMPFWRSVFATGAYLVSLTACMVAMGLVFG